MSENVINGVVTIAVAVIGVAILAVLVSSRGQTANVISAGASGLARDITAAVAPVMGGGGYGGGGFTGGPAEYPTVY